MLTAYDVSKEISLIYKKEWAPGEFHVPFCNVNKGMTFCDRYQGHNGKHAHVSDPVIVKTRYGFRYYEFTKVVTWK